jgi:hypothetical protein
VPADLPSMDCSQASAGYTNRVECAHLSTTLVSQTYPRNHAVAVAMLFAYYILIAVLKRPIPLLTRPWSDAVTLIFLFLSVSLSAAT